MQKRGAITLTTFLTLALVCGCASSRSQRIASDLDSAPTVNAAESTERQQSGGSAVETAVRQVEFQETSETGSEPIDIGRETQQSPLAGMSLIQLEQIAIEQNPRLTRLEQEYQAAAARSHFVDKLPDPKLGANVFGDPIETASGSQRANMNLSQTIPWLGKLNAKQWPTPDLCTTWPSPL
ncbi:MAG: hypothetical protein HOH82_09395 [Planctomycetaceae bacterium]|nr:hypothetical protein [Planctomycetaceae bacterium]